MAAQDSRRVLAASVGDRADAEELAEIFRRVTGLLSGLFERERFGGLGSVQCVQVGEYRVNELGAVNVRA